MRARTFLLVCVIVFALLSGGLALLAYVEGRGPDGGLFMSIAFTVAFLMLAVRLPAAEATAACGQCGHALTDALDFCGRCGQHAQRPGA